MTSNEVYIAKGNLAELNKRYSEIELRADSLLIQIRELLNPINEFLDYNLDLALALVKDFRALQIEARQIQHKIMKIKDSYNL